MAGVALKMEKDTTMHKASIEKLAKQKEIGLTSSITTDNKSVLRALARLEAVKELYKELTEEQQLEGLIELFYKDAKWQQSWKDPLEKHAPVLAARMQGKLGMPAPRIRKKAPEMPPPPTEDPEAVLGAKSA
jgi:regulator of sirC expression with transglutaminase-like and TPR domain